MLAVAKRRYGGLKTGVHACKQINKTQDKYCIKVIKYEM